MLKANYLSGRREIGVGFKELFYASSHRGNYSGSQIYKLVLAIRDSIPKSNQIWWERLMETQLLRAILMTTGRQTFPVSSLLAIVAPMPGSEKQVAAFNLCDGHHTQADISKETGIDKGNLSRSMSRWIEAGILFRIGADELPLHIYPIPKSAMKTSKAGDSI